MKILLTVASEDLVVRPGPQIQLLYIEGLLWERSW